MRLNFSWGSDVLQRGGSVYKVVVLCLARATLWALRRLRLSRFAMAPRRMRETWQGDVAYLVPRVPCLTIGKVLCVQAKFLMGASKQRRASF